MYPVQLMLPNIEQNVKHFSGDSVREHVETLLASDLDFHNKDSSYASHNFHAFPAKFPPQLPRKFIEELTRPGDTVLDPMVGSGTTIVEASLTGRRGIGVDIDPMALQFCKVKVTPLDLEQVAMTGYQVLHHAPKILQRDGDELRRHLRIRFGKAEQEFLDYWFLPLTQLELLSLVLEIERVQEPRIREFLELVFSAIIITKSGGVSMAQDLAHTRPHRVPNKAPRSALDEYRKRLKRNLESLASLGRGNGTADVICGNAQRLPLCDRTVDLIVTSPPYASNAIDYMRAHKFSLVWLGHSLANLSRLRQEYIGHDALMGFPLVPLPDSAHQVVTSIAQADEKKAKVLHRYYSEMASCLSEMARVLKPGKAVIVVVGSSNMRGIDTRTDICLAELGKQVGLDLVGVARRKLDRDRRMMPARRSKGLSQIEERMHEEYVLGFVKE